MFQRHPVDEPAARDRHWFLRSYARMLAGLTSVAAITFVLTTIGFRLTQISIIREGVPLVEGYQIRRATEVWGVNLVGPLPDTIGRFLATRFGVVPGVTLVVVGAVLALTCRWYVRAR